MQAPTTTLTERSNCAAEESVVADNPVGEERSHAEWWMWVLTGALFLTYLLLSLRLHERLLTNSFDLAIFEQAVRSYAEGRLPVSEVKGPDFPLLGDHFSPIVALIAPLYWLWPSPKALLAVQAGLIAASVLPLTLWARRVLGSGMAVVIGVSYGISWGIASAISIDFHEVAFAAPLLAYALVALANGRMRQAACGALPLLLVKEDLGFSVAVFGVLIALRGARRLGITTAVVGLCGSLLQLLVILPFFNPGGGYGRLQWLGDSGGDNGGVGDLFYRFTIGLITPEIKMTTLVLVLAPSLFLALRSPLIWVAAPTLLWRFASSYDVPWGTTHHYSLVLMPIVFASFIDALVRRQSSKGSVRRYVASCAAIGLLLLPQFPLWRLFESSMWRSEPRVGVAHRLMARVPDGATVQASNALVPHLADRTSVSIYGWPTSRPNPQWIMVDTLVPWDQRWPLSESDERASLARARNSGYLTVAEQDGFVLLSRSG
ncbi:DUF2079 domain-containing protein [Streptomyces sp. NBC_01619]|uniref:DUF2079 domain-containing protein n=1 Tax=Streptomyces sp. NBC_01619 TaxID=2975901 RepID=UPI002253FEBF|nr:DUF2079 domain-containing protein [Streptomyces sp. NBC_01619]MCX4515739.1 DUF2079 domain-containing protein [Streptomyces sp. NBC_01619]